MRPLVLNAGPGPGLDGIDPRAVGAIAVPWPDAAGLVPAALAAGLGVVLAPGAGWADAEAALDAQLSAGATLVLAPADQAEAAIDAWGERQGWRPPPQRPDAPGRRLFATVSLGDPVEIYAGLEVDGFWLDAGAERSAGAVARLALELQRRSDRPVVVAGAGAAALALLASGVAAVGPPAVDGDAVFHPAILSSFPAGARYAAVRRRLFAMRPCACGAHRAAEPPPDRAATLAHNRFHLQAEALEAAAMIPPIAEARLLARAGRASTLRRELGLTPLAAAAGWRAVAGVAQELRGSGEMAG
ncbi:MAG: hypothetical protein QOF76_1584 [Solirubrobacteraceae bacterium]|jgi:hypothetical protein|nr:hypothetical protein [Solirubrobacteraceae bacterium]